MKKLKNLPSLIIYGELQDLLELETLLILIGYDNSLEEAWNEKQMNCQEFPLLLLKNNPSIELQRDGSMLYTSWRSVEYANFAAKDINNIIKYIQNYK